VFLYAFVCLFELQWQGSINDISICSKLHTHTHTHTCHMKSWYIYNDNVHYMKVLLAEKKTRKHPFHTLTYNQSPWIFKHSFSHCNLVNVQNNMSEVWIVKRNILHLWFTHKSEITHTIFFPFNGITFFAKSMIYIWSPYNSFTYRK